MLEYILKVSICWLAFYTIYFAFLRKETFFKLNRKYLLSTLCFGLFIPFLENLTYYVPVETVSYIAPLNLDLLSDQIAAIAPASDKSAINYMTILFGLYLAGLSIASFRFIYGLLNIYSLYKRSEITRLPEYQHVNTEMLHLPFSFFNLLFISKQHDLVDEDKERILLHEKAHIEGGHSYDVLLLEVLSIIFWCSPLIYLYKKSIKTVHEYLADDRVLESTSTKQYGLLLLGQSNTSLQLLMANHFHSQLKQRIIMMTKSKSTRKNLMKYALMLPVLLILIFGFTQCEKADFLEDSDLIAESNVSDSMAKNLQKISITKSGSFSYEGVAISDNAIHDLMKGMKGETIIVAPHEEAPIEKVARIMDLSMRYKVETILEEDLVSNESKVYKKVEQMPRFPGCEEGTEDINQCAQNKMLEFIYTNIKYPAEARMQNIEGVTVIRFIVESTGKIKNAKVVRGIGGGCDEESLRVVNLMPDFIPGMEKGKKVDVQYNIPIRFKFMEEDK